MAEGLPGPINSFQEPVPVVPLLSRGDATLPRRAWGGIYPGFFHAFPSPFFTPPAKTSGLVLNLRLPGGLPIANDPD